MRASSICFQQLGITYDLFTTTHTQNHFSVSQRIFLALKKNGFLYTETQITVVLPSAQPLPARPLRGGHLLYLRIRSKPAATSAINAATCSTRPS